jgi:hypothetical protein
MKQRGSAGDGGIVPLGPPHAQSDKRVFILNEKHRSNRQCTQSTHTLQNEGKERVNEQQRKRKRKKRCGSFSLLLARALFDPMNITVS